MRCPSKGVASRDDRHSWCDLHAVYSYNNNNNVCKFIIASCQVVTNEWPVAAAALKCVTVWFLHSCLQGEGSETNEQKTDARHRSPGPCVFSGIKNKTFFFIFVRSNRVDTGQKATKAKKKWQDTPDLVHIYSTSSLPSGNHPRQRYTGGYLSEIYILNICFFIDTLINDCVFSDDSFDIECAVNTSVNVHSGRKRNANICRLFFSFFFFF